MKTTVSIYDFRDAFRQYGRADNFSYDGLRVLFEFLEEYEDSTGSEVELDVIAVCCEYDEGKPEDVAKTYGIELEDDGNQLNNVLDWLHDQTIVCGVTEDGLIVYQAF